MSGKPITRAAPDRERARAHAERGADLYETSPYAVRALVHVEHVPARVWDPACGPGAIVNELRDLGRDAYASDLMTYDLPGARWGIDFLTAREAPPGVEAIVMNPPYRLDDAFIGKAIELVPRVYALMRLAYLAGLRWGDAPPYGRGFGRHLRRVHVFSPRLPPMHQDGWTGPKVESATRDTAWFVFERGVSPTTPTINWIDWRETV